MIYFIKKVKYKVNNKVYWAILAKPRKDSTAIDISFLKASTKYSDIKWDLEVYRYRSGDVPFDKSILSFPNWDFGDLIPS